MDDVDRTVPDRKGRPLFDSLTHANQPSATWLHDVTISQLTGGRPSLYYSEADLPIGPCVARSRRGRYLGTLRDVRTGEGEGGSGLEGIQECCPGRSYGQASDSVGARAGIDEAQDPSGRAAAPCTGARAAPASTGGARRPGTDERRRHAPGPRHPGILPALPDGLLDRTLWRRLRRRLRRALREACRRHDGARRWMRGRRASALRGTFTTSCCSARSNPPDPLRETGPVPGAAGRLADARPWPEAARPAGRAAPRSDQRPISAASEAGTETLRNTALSLAKSEVGCSAT